AVGARHELAIAGLLQAEHIAPVQALALLEPVLSAIVRSEYATQLAVVYHADKQSVGIFLVRQNRSNVAVRVAMIGGEEAVSAVIASHHASAVGSQHDPLRVARIDHHIVDHDIWIAYTGPHFARVGCLPKAFGGSGINDRRVAGILLQHPGAPCGKRDALNFLKESPALWLL